MALRRTSQKENEDPAPLPASSIEFLMRLEEAGLTEDLARMVLEEKDNASATRVVTLLGELTRAKRMERTLIKSDVLPPYHDILERILLLSQAGNIQWRQKNKYAYGAETNDIAIRIDHCGPDFMLSLGDLEWETRRGYGFKATKEYEVAKQIWNICERQVERRKGEEAHSLLKNLGG